MSKNTKNNVKNYATTIEIPQGTLTESFKKFIEKDDSTERILNFLSVQNSRYLAKSGISEEFSKEEKEELYDFYSYFMENYGEQTQSARYNNWGNEAFIFRLADSLYSDDCQRENIEFMKTVSKDVLKEAKSLTEKIFSIRKDKHVSCCTDGDMWIFYIPKTISKKFLQTAKEETTVYFAKIIALTGTIVVRIFNDGTKPDQIFGIIGTESSWLPISKDKMKTADIKAQKNCNIGEIMEYIEIEK